MLIIFNFAFFFIKCIFRDPTLAKLYLDKLIQFILVEQLLLGQLSQEHFDRNQIDENAPLVLDILRRTVAKGVQQRRFSQGQLCIEHRFSTEEVIEWDLNRVMKTEWICNRKTSLLYSDLASTIVRISCYLPALSFPSQFCTSNLKFSTIFATCDDIIIPFRYCDLLSLVYFCPTKVLPRSVNIYLCASFYSLGTFLEKVNDNKYVREGKMNKYLVSHGKRVVQSTLLCIFHGSNQRFQQVQFVYLEFIEFSEESKESSNLEINPE